MAFWPGKSASQDIGNTYIVSASLQERKKKKRNHFSPNPNEAI